MGNVFVGHRAVAAGRLTRHELQRWYRPIYRGVYVPKRHEPSLRDRTVGALLTCRQRAVVSGIAASALHGARWIDADTPIELIAPSARPQSGLLVRNERLAEDEITRVAGIPVTTPARTAFDIGRHLHREAAVARLDSLMYATPFSVEDVLLLAKRYPGARGLRRLRAVHQLPRLTCRLAEGDLVAAVVDRRGVSAACHADTCCRRLATCPHARHGLGRSQGGRRVRRRPTSHEPQTVRERHSVPAKTATPGLDRGAGDRRGPRGRHHRSSGRCPHSSWIPARLTFCRALRAFCLQNVDLGAI